jgi:DNA polymerase-3 subunit alpha
MKGIFDVTVYSDEVAKNCAELMEVKQIVIVTCDAVRDEGGIKLTAKHFERIDAVNNIRTDLDLTIRDFDALQKCLEAAIRPQGNNSMLYNINIYLKTYHDLNFHIKIPGQVRLDSRNIEYLLDLCK